MDIIMGGKLKNLKSHFWPDKFTNIGPDLYQKMQNNNIFGGMFPKKGWYCQYFQKIIMILGFWDYNKGGDNSSLFLNIGETLIPQCC